MADNATISESRFNMWRALVALIHTDHKVMDEECDFFLRRFDAIPFTEEQKELLRQDMYDEQDVSKIYERISDKEDRATLIYFARLLFWCDGEFHAQEDAILQHLHQQTISKLDLEAIMTDVNAEVRRTMTEYDIAMESKQQNSGPWSAFFFALSAGLWPAKKIRDMLSD